MEKKVTKEVWWGVEYIEHGKKIVEVHFRRHRSAPEARVRFSEKLKKPWKELEKQGAKVVRRDVWTGVKPPDWFSIE
jgi:hypothetical protein